MHFNSTAEYVVLVDAENCVVGSALKADVHTQTTPLHRAFSCFCFRADGSLLTQRRALHKVTWPGIWANSVCGHPGPGESTECAVYRRLRHELGVTTVSKLTCMLPAFQYTATLDGVMENEICPVYAAIMEQDATPNPQEVDAVAWIPWNVFLHLCRNVPGSYAPWTLWETEELLKSTIFARFLTSLGIDPHTESEPSA